MTEDNRDVVMPNGKFAGERIQRVPVNYLIWMVNVRHTHANLAQAELNRRGTVVPEIDVSGHAIDKASLRCRKIWHQTALSPEEGLHAWLVRMAKDAWESSSEVDKRKINYRGMWFVFETDGAYPIVKTVIKAGSPRPRKRKRSDFPDDHDDQTCVGGINESMDSGDWSPVDDMEPEDYGNKD